MGQVSVIIPAYNEEALIGDTLRALQPLPDVAEIVLVDDGSGDATALVAERLGAKVIRHGRNRGKGAALNTGLQAAGGQYVCFLDADLGGTAQAAEKLYAPVLNAAADITIAHFPPAQTRGGFGLATGLARWGLRQFTGTIYSSPLSGQRAMARQVAERLAPFADGFGVEVAFTIDAHRLGFRVIEVPLDMRHRETGRSLPHFYHRGRQCCHIARVLCGKVWR